MDNYMVPEGVESAGTDSSFTVKNNPATERPGGCMTLFAQVVKEEVSKLPSSLTVKPSLGMCGSREPSL